ncbi:putative meiotic recombination protein spo11 [Trypanosoma rangeli]|uniref:DNA topoisomerase (ATP-hydrolyzing) n=1 Tax=Trypanosoma rangeli TaxID=5698 RepID=A0A3R7KBQ4_TRYRA|nr:putative meiotic recombination protein spo11 [Trypanosoma rangeli]RNE97405.1 putative meiotic recombination protein spo11 [Trypanosoma rangeli]|eukprot:RNE97405.1 putative meiotic recombination protein spo11 [Trypanosoma rangeli]
MTTTAAAVAKKSKTQQNQRLFVDSTDSDFISPDIVAANTPAALTAEAVRRMEVFVLRTIYEIVSTTQQLALREGRLSVIRLQLLVLHLLYHNLHLGILSTQRDVYYRLARLVPDQGCINRAIQQLVQILGIPRQWLGVVPGTRGCVGGSLSFHGVDLRYSGSEGLPLPTTREELRVVLGSVKGTYVAMREEDAITGFELHGQTRYLIVVEKHAIFFRLMEERIFERVPCVLLTSHGFPTVAARTLLSNLHRAAPRVPVVALVDYNPSGLSILQQYKYSAGGMRESQYSAVHALHWLGLRSPHILQGSDPGVVASHPLVASKPPPPLRLLPSLPFQPFTQRDTAMMANLLSRWRGLSEGCKGTDTDAVKAWYAEALKMQQLRVKVELEVLYQHGADELMQTSLSSFQLSDRHSFAAWVCRIVLRHDYI